jgi:hypothetical protein
MNLVKTKGNDRNLGKLGIIGENFKCPFQRDQLIFCLNQLLSYGRVIRTFGFVCEISPRM